MQTWRILPNGGGVIFNRSIHSIDLVRWLLRDEVASVYARSPVQILSNVVEEDVVAQLEMRRTGNIIQTHDSFLIPHNPTQIEIFGSAGTLAASHCFVDEPASELWLMQHETEHRSPAGTAATVSRRSSAASTTPCEASAQPLAGGGDGLHNLTVALAMRESMQSGRLRRDPARLAQRGRPFRGVIAWPVSSISLRISDWRLARYRWGQTLAEKLQSAGASGRMLAIWIGIGDRRPRVRSGASPSLPGR